MAFADLIDEKRMEAEALEKYYRAKPLCDLLGITQPTLMSWKADPNLIDYERAKRIADYYGKTVEEVYE